jgi:molybdopterin synthase sulfur carrier subunit
MRRVRILYFAATRDAVGRGEEECELPDAVATVADFIRFVAAAHVMLAPRMESVRIARNERFAESADRIEHGDVLALIPPVAGG